MTMHRLEWGSGDTVLALHPLALDASGFAGFGRVLAERGMRTVAVDLPGFGRTPAPAGTLTPAVMARPVVELARAMPRPPHVLGISMGGRVALEAAMRAPESFRSVTAIAPYIPWKRCRSLLKAVRHVDPALAEKVPIEIAWPLLKRLADRLGEVAFFREDELGQAAMRFVYYVSCPATRAAFLAAWQGLALDPPRGEHGFWPRLSRIEIPVAFVWGERDGLISPTWSVEVGRHLPAAEQLLLPCAGHWLNGRHHRCVAEAAARLLEGPLRSPQAFGTDGARLSPVGEEVHTCDCVAGARAPREPPWASFAGRPSANRPFVSRSFASRWRQRA